MAGMGSGAPRAFELVSSRHTQLAPPMRRSGSVPAMCAPWVSQRTSSSVPVTSLVPTAAGDVAQRKERGLAGLGESNEAAQGPDWGMARKRSGPEWETRPLRCEISRIHVPRWERGGVRGRHWGTWGRADRAGAAPLHATDLGCITGSSHDRSGMRCAPPGVARARRWSPSLQWKDLIGMGVFRVATRSGPMPPPRNLHRFIGAGNLQSGVLGGLWGSLSSHVWNFVLRIYDSVLGPSPRRFGGLGAVTACQFPGDLLKLTPTDPHRPPNLRPRTGRGLTPAWP
jgi:hypothetical protein